jgi:hypothetical protein
MEDYTQKYLKYKGKYLNLQKQYLKYTNIAPTIPNPISNSPIIRSPLIPNPITNTSIIN